MFVFFYSNDTGFNALLVSFCAGAGCTRNPHFPKSPEEPKLLGDTEDKFKELRFLMHQVNAMRRTIETADRHATKFFDETIIYDTQPRIKKSKMDNVPNVEEPTIIKVPETAQ